MSSKCISKLLSGVFKVICFIIAIGAILGAIYAFFRPNEKQSATLIISLFGVALVAIILVITIDKISEITIGGVSIKIGNIEKQVSYNKSYFSKKDNEFYWVDKDGHAHKVPDYQTALFLSKDKSITTVKKIRYKPGEPYPSLKIAKPKSPNGTDLFIFYNDKLYYQSGLGWLYWIAEQNGIDYKSKFDSKGELIERIEFKDWKNSKKDGKFVEKLEEGDIQKMEG